MNKIPRKFKVPLMMLIMLPTMILGLPAIITYKNLAEGEQFFTLWLHAVSQAGPIALVMAITVGATANFIISKLLLVPEE